MHLLIKFASRSRPVKFFEGLHNIIDLAADKENYTVFCCLDLDDGTMFAHKLLLPHIQDQIDQYEEKFKHVVFNYGYSKSKIDAINREVPHNIKWDVLVNFSDDMRFVVHGYDELIRQGVSINGPDVFLHYPDSFAKNMLSTMSIMDRQYFERDKYIYHPSYKSLWCDNEAQDVAQTRGRYVYMGIQIFDHYHPAYGTVPWDNQYSMQQAHWNEDETNYKRRKFRNFPA